MVENEIRDGDRIASLLRAEIEGLEDPPFEGLGIHPPEDARGEDERDAEGIQASSPAFTVHYQERVLFEVGTQPDRIILEFGTLQAEIRDAAAAQDLRVRPKATRPPATLVFVERGADVKRVIDVLRACLPPQ